LLSQIQLVPLQRGNRNPFVDKPDLVAVVFITGASAPSAAAPAAAESPSSPSAAAAAAAADGPMPWINEVHYDDAGADAGEFVEIALPLGGPAAAAVSVTLHNGNGGLPYWGPTLLSEAPFVRGAATGGGAVVLYSAAIAGMQNGAPDGVALAVSGGGRCKYNPDDP
jgi:hypothetical protein